MSSSIRVQGFDSLVNKLEKMGQAGSVSANKGLRAGAKVIVDYQKKDAPRHKNGPANGKSKHGADSLKVGKIVTAKSKNKYVQIGITDAAVWENSKGIYFQHHGFFNKRTNRYHAGSQWMDKSFEKAKEQAVSALVSVLEKELRL